MATCILVLSAIFLCGIVLMPGCDGVMDLDKPLYVTEEAWFEVKVMNDKNETAWQGRFTIALFGDVAPMTVMNFVAITRGYKRGKDYYHYKNTTIHRIVKDFCVQMGDITIGDGTGGKSIYGDTFIDEPFVLSHRAPGWVAMANHGKDTNGSQFYILLTKARWLDNKHVVFGKVIQGYDVLRQLGELPTHYNAVPLNPVWIVDCGIRGVKEKYVFPKDMLDSTEDMD